MLNVAKVYCCFPYCFFLLVDNFFQFQHLAFYRLQYPCLLSAVLEKKRQFPTDVFGVLPDVDQWLVCSWRGDLETVGFPFVLQLVQRSRDLSAQAGTKTDL